VIAPASAAVAWIAAALFLAPARPGKVTPQLEALAIARKRGDAIELERVARVLGAARLTVALASDVPRVRAAAVAAAPFVDDAWTLLEPLAKVAQATEPPVGREAADAAGRIADGLSPAGGDEIPYDQLRLAATELVRAAVPAGRDVEQRVAALGAVASLATRFPPDLLADLPPLLEDVEPRVRRAAVEALGAVPAQRAAARLVGVAKKDPAPEVAAVAAAAVCRAVESLPAPAAWMIELGPRVRELARGSLAKAASVPPEDALELLRCLYLAGTAVDRQILGELAQRHADAQVRSDAHKLLAQPPSVPRSLPPAAAAPARAPAGRPAPPPAPRR
jgi:hypothetical protein